MTKTEIVNEVLKSLPLPVYERLGKKRAKKFVKMVLDSFFDLIIDTTAAGEDVRIQEFAKFFTHYHGPHKVYTGLTHQYVEARGHVRIKMKPARRWREAVSEGAETWKSTVTNKTKTKAPKPPAKKGSARSAEPK